MVLLRPFDLQVNLKNGLNGPDVLQPVAKEPKLEPGNVLAQMTARMEIKLLKMANIWRRKSVRVTLTVNAKSKRRNASFRQKVTILMNAKMMLPSALALEMKLVPNVQITSQILTTCISAKPRCPTVIKSLNSRIS